MIIIEVLGTPISLNRPRACKRGEFIAMYDSQVKEKQQVRWQISGQYKEKPLTVPLAVDILFCMPIPKQTSKVRTKEMLAGKLVPMKKPDIDNLIKFCFDCLNEILFNDDSQIVEVSARKIYSESPRTVIRAINIDEKHTGDMIDEGNC